MVFYFVDSSDDSRLKDSLQLFHDTINESELQESSIVIIANKQDLNNSLSTTEISTYFNVDELTKSGWLITCIGTCSITGDGLYEALDWVKLNLDLKKKSNPKRSLELGNNSISTEVGNLTVATTTVPLDPLESLLIEWLERIDMDDETFLNHLHNATLDNWLVGFSIFLYNYYNHEILM